MTWEFLGMKALGWAFCAALIATILIGWWSARRNPKRTDALAISWVVAVVWLSARISDATIHIPASMLLYPIVDAIAATLIFTHWARQPAAWKYLTGSSLLVQIVFHVVFWFLHDPSDEALRRYILALNILFAIQLGSVSIGGLWDAGLGLDHGFDHLLRRIDRRRGRSVALDEARG